MIKESMLIMPPPLASNIGGATLPFRHNPMKKVPSMTINKMKARTYRLRRKYPNPGTNHPPMISRSTIYLISYTESPKADKYGSLLDPHIINPHFPMKKNGDMSTKIGLPPHPYPPQADIK
jgi:hypothetical protein